MKCVWLRLRAKYNKRSLRNLPIIHIIIQITNYERILVTIIPFPPYAQLAPESPLAAWWSFCRPTAAVEYLRVLEGPRGARWRRSRVLVASSFLALPGVTPLIGGVTLNVPFVAGPFPWPRQGEWW